MESSRESDNHNAWAQRRQMRHLPSCKLNNDSCSHNTLIKEGAVHCYFSFSLYTAPLEREATVWSENKQVLFLQFWLPKPFCWLKARWENLMITAATEQMLEDHHCCPLRHKGLLISGWICWPSFSRLSFSSDGNLLYERQKVTVQSTPWNNRQFSWSWITSAAGENSRNINWAGYSIMWYVWRQEVIAFILIVLQTDSLHNKDPALRNLQSFTYEEYIVPNKIVVKSIIVTLKHDYIVAQLCRYRALLKTS